METLFALFALFVEFNLTYMGRMQETSDEDG